MILALCVITKDERLSYASEWVDWHRKQGVERFFVYNNGVEPFVTGPDIEERPWPGKQVQLRAYNHCLANCDGAEFVGFIDMDEFIVGPLLPALVKTKNGLALNWRMYGSSGIIYNHLGRQLGVFVKHTPPTADVNAHIKSIVRVRSTASVSGNPHAFVYRDGRGAETVNGKSVIGAFHSFTVWPEVLINHYAVRSKADWLFKAYRGRADAKDTLYDLTTLDTIDRLSTETDKTKYL